jgi:hypothetical protein
MPSLGNLLSRSKEFAEAGEERVIDDTGHGQNYDVKVWRLVK